MPVKTGKEEPKQHLLSIETDRMVIQSGATNITARSRNNSTEISNEQIVFVNESEIPDRLSCVNCGHVMTDPLVIRTCGHHMCNSCVQKLTDKGSKVGKCRRESCSDDSFRLADVQNDHGLRRDLQNVLIYCPHRDNGCNSQIPLGQVKQHLKSCITAQMVNSGNSALLSVIGQLQTQMETMKQSITRLQEERQQSINTIKGLEQTVQSMGEKNKAYEKTLAKVLAEKNEIPDTRKLEDIIGEVNQLKIQAESQSTKLSSMEATVSETLTGRPTGQIKTMFRKTNEKVALHDIEISDHDIRLQCVENLTHDGKLVWKIANLSDHMEKAKSGKTLSLYSQPFYSDLRGYKLCGRVYLNGDGIGKGNHVSFYIVVMKGTYDDLLEWPFQHQVTLGAIDVKTKGAKTVTETFKPNKDSNSFKKPVSTMNVACGCPKFLSHKDLFSGSFIKDDTMYLTVELEQNVS